MKKTSSSILGKYSDKKMDKKAEEESQIPRLAHYEQRYKGMAKSITEPVPVPTLEEKIKARDEKPVEERNTRIPVVIGGTRYLLGTSETVSELRIHRIATLANKFLEEAKSTNPGLTNSKTAILALIDICDEYISLKSEYDNLKTELMYYQQQDLINKSANKVEPTPMEVLADLKGNQE